MSKRFPYDQTIADEICDRLIDGESLRAICRDEHMPSAGLVCRWAIENERFREQYAHARDAQADTLADEILEIADDARNDWMERHGKDDPGWALNGEHVQRSKVRIDARRWYAGKLKPKKYGDKTIHAGDDESPIKIERIERHIVDAVENASD